MSDLVVFYSLSGKSRLVAEWLATAIHADVAEIVEARPRDFAFRGIMRSLIDSFLRRKPPIAPMAKRVANYDRVTLVCPVWAGRMAGPARSWLHAEGRNAKRLGLALTLGGGPHAAVFQEFEAVTNKKPVPVLEVIETDFANKIAERKVADFARSVLPEMARFPKN